MKIAVLFTACLLWWILLPGQEKVSIQVGKPFAYRDNRELNAFLDRETSRKTIIDLFSSTCAACFSMMPKMQQIQEKYGDSIHVVLLGQKDKEIDKIFRRFRDRFSLSLDVVYDSAFFKKYQLPGFPFYIWIDEKGIVQAATGSDELHEANLASFMRGKPVIPASDPYNIDPVDPALTFGRSEEDSAFLFRSKLGLARKGELSYYPQRLTYSMNNKKTFLATGVTVDDLYRYAYFGIARWLVKDPEYSKLYHPPVRLGGKSNTAGLKLNYLFQTNEEDRNGNLLQRALQNDLATYFGYEVLVTQMRVPCWKLVALPGAADRLRSRETKKKVKTSYSYQDFRHVPVSRIIELFQFSAEDDLPVIDDTRIDFPVDIIAKLP
jgi:thiol-disulfide isomerase/thioredoxin